jgi:DNA-directed RNA polymerase sigma subunit (sigma70/sigma32)
MEVLDPALAKKIGNIINVALTDLQRQAFLWSCGIGSPNGDAMTVREISEALGTSRENIYAAHKRALKVIRDTLSGERPLRPPGAIHKPKPKNKDKNK